MTTLDLLAKIQELAELPPLEYETQRQTVAKDDPRRGRPRRHRIMERARPALERLGDRQFLRRLAEVEAALRE